MRLQVAVHHISLSAILSLHTSTVTQLPPHAVRELWEVVNQYLPQAHEPSASNTSPKFRSTETVSTRSIVQNKYLFLSLDTSFEEGFYTGLKILDLLLLKPIELNLEPFSRLIKL